MRRYLALAIVAASICGGCVDAAEARRPDSRRWANPARLAPGFSSQSALDGDGVNEYCDSVGFPFGVETDATVAIWVKYQSNSSTDVVHRIRSGSDSFQLNVTTTWTAVFAQTVSTNLALGNTETDSWSLIIQEFEGGVAARGYILDQGLAETALTLTEDTSDIDASLDLSAADIEIFNASAGFYSDVRVAEFAGWDRRIADIPTISTADDLHDSGNAKDWSDTAPTFWLRFGDAGGDHTSLPDQGAFGEDVPCFNFEPGDLVADGPA